MRFDLARSKRQFSCKEKQMDNRVQLKHLAHIGMIVCIVALVAGCGISSSIKETNREIANAVDSFDRAINALSQESADWRIVVQDLQKEISEDMQSTIRTELDNLTRSAILTASSELRCNAEFMRISIERELIRIRNRLAQEINIQLAQLPFYTNQVPIIPEKLAEPFICSVVPSAIDLNIDHERRVKIDIFGFDLRSRPITVELITYGNLLSQGRVLLPDFREQMIRHARIGGARIVTDSFVLETPSSRLRQDITGALSIISDFHAVIDLTDSGVDIEPNAQEIVLSWNSKIQSEIAVLAHQQFLECDVITKTIHPGAKSFTPPALNDNICSGKPDKDFAGHGPCVTFQISLALDSERKKLNSSYSMNAWECPDDFDFYRSDCTEAKGSSSFTLYNAQEDEKILSFDVVNSVSDQYIDTDHAEDKTYFGGTEPLSELAYIGDTDGNEAGTKTRVKMTFRGINLQVERCQLR